MERLLELFAGLLEYPRPELPWMARECELQAAVPEAVNGLREFRRFVEQTPPAELEEAYTAAFDLGADRCPYVGYHLFGDGYARSAFLQELKRRFRERGLETGSELPDHLSCLLRFASACGAGEERREIVDEAILPALRRMTAGAAAPGDSAGAPAADTVGTAAADAAGEGGAGSPDAYAGLLQALAAVLAGG